MDRLTAFGLFAVTAMLVTYALETRSHCFTLAFAGACGLGSAYWQGRAKGNPAGPGKRDGVRTAGQSALPSWLILAVATSSIIPRSESGTTIGVQALSPSMKNTMPPEWPSTLTSAALSP